MSSRNSVLTRDPNRNRYGGLGNAEPKGSYSAVFLCLRLSIRSRGPGVEVVDEGNVVTHKDVVLDGDPLANEGMSGDLAVLSDFGPLLNFHKGHDLRAIADRAAVEIDKIVDPDVPTLLYI